MWPTGALKFLKNYFTTPLKFSKLPNFFHSQNFKPLQHCQATTFPLSLVERFKDFLFPGLELYLFFQPGFNLINKHETCSSLAKIPTLSVYPNIRSGLLGSLRYFPSSPLLKVWQMIVCSEDQKVIFIHNMRRRRVRLRGVIWDLRKYISTTKWRICFDWKYQHLK